MLLPGFPGPYPIISHVIGAPEVVLAPKKGCSKGSSIPPSLEAKNLPRPARHHNKSRRTFRWNGVTFQVSPEFWEECLAADAKPLELMRYSPEVEAELDRMAAKAKGSNKDH